MSTELVSPDTAPANILFVAVVPALHPFAGPVLLATAADRSLRIYSAQPPFGQLRAFAAPSDAALLCVAVAADRWLLLSTMTGRLALLDPATGDVVATVRPHEKYATRVVYSAPFVVSSAYDRTIALHALCTPSDPDAASSAPPSFSECVGRLTLSTPPEALAVVTLPSTGTRAVVFSRRESMALYYHLLEPSLPHHATRSLAGASGVWLGYDHPLAVALHPRDPTRLAVVTSSVPHMRLLIVPVDSDGGGGGGSDGERASNREMFTGAPQTVYSTAALAWRPDASGVWVNADEGIVRGVEVKRGRVAARLAVCAHGQKVRTLWAGSVDGVGELLVTGGFDKALRVWTVARAD